MSVIIKPGIHSAIVDAIPEEVCYDSNAVVRLDRHLKDLIATGKRTFHSHQR